jgi:hypothetical protein
MDDPNDSRESAEPQAIGFVRKAMESIQEHLAALLDALEEPTEAATAGELAAIFSEITKIALATATQLALRPLNNSEVVAELNEFLSELNLPVRLISHTH